MDNSEQICRACMCKNQSFHSLYAKATDRPLTICEMFATILPQLPIHNNDEMSKVICTKCLKTLIVVHEFQEMCVASDTCMRSLLISKSLISEASTKEQPPEDIKYTTLSNLEYAYTRIVSEDPLKLPSAIKVEKDGDEGCSDLEGNSQWSEEDVRPLRLNSKLQNFIKFESGEVEVQECDMKPHLNAESESSNVKDKSANLYDDAECDNDPDWSADSESGHHGKSVKEAHRSEKHNTSISSIDIDENQTYEIEKPNSLPRRKYRFRCEHCNAGFTSNYKLKHHSVVHLESRKFVCETCSFRFETPKTLSVHISVEHENCFPEGYKCPKCPRRFEMRKSLRAHLGSHRLLKCKWCTKQFRKKENMLNHVRKHPEYQKERILTEKDSEWRENTDISLFPVEAPPIEEKDACQKNERRTNESILEQYVAQKVGDSERIDAADIIEIEQNQSTSSVEIELCSDTMDIGNYHVKSLPKIYEKEKSLQSSTKVNDESRDFKVKKPYSQSRFRCEICNAVFPSDISLKRHSELHLQSRRFSCELCSYRFKTAGALLVHKRSHDVPPLEGFKCPVCQRRFEKFMTLSGHFRHHQKTNPEESFKCKLCPNKFKKVMTLMNHERIHFEIQKYDCLQCDATFDTSTLLEDHINKKHESKLHVCEYCQKEFKKSSNAHSHRKTHEKPFLCPECGKSFGSNTILKDHLLRHSGEKLFECPECPRKFSCRVDRWKHQQIHVKTKPSKACDICGQKFARSEAIRIHKMTKHSDDRPFKCSECDMTFQRQFSFARHKRTHTGEKPHKCKFCEKAYSAPGDLTKHLRTHVGEKTYMCKKCPEKFKYFKKLRDHEAFHYRQQHQAANDANEEKQQQETNDANEEKIKNLEN